MQEKQIDRQPTLNQGNSAQPHPITPRSLAQHAVLAGLPPQNVSTTKQVLVTLPVSLGACWVTEPHW